MVTLRKHYKRWIETFTIALLGFQEAALPAFGFEEEAEPFLGFEARGAGAVLDGQVTQVYAMPYMREYMTSLWLCVPANKGSQTSRRKQ